MANGSRGNKIELSRRSHSFVLENEIIFHTPFIDITSTICLFRSAFLF